MAEPWTLAQAQEHLSQWLQADIACSTSQSYTISGRTLTRSDLSQIAERIHFWRNECTRLQAGRGHGARVMNIIPRDL
ncbi:MAG TPA: DUF6148 family protein [Armatimonadota bacterium]|jgi:hypothetical protein